MTVFSRDKQAIVKYAIACSTLGFTVQVKPLSLSDKRFGYCRKLASGDILIRVRPGLSTNEFLAVLWHELAHAIQINSGAFRSTNKSFYWCGRRARMAYSKQPWEIEADYYSKKMLETFLNLTVEF